MYGTHSHHGAQLHKLAAAREKKIQPRQAQVDVAERLTF